VLANSKICERSGFDLENSLKKGFYVRGKPVLEGEKLMIFGLWSLSSLKKILGV